MLIDHLDRARGAALSCACSTAAGRFAIAGARRLPHPCGWECARCAVRRPCRRPGDSSGSCGSNRIDIVQTHFPDSTYFAVPLARLAGVRRDRATRRNLGHWLKPTSTAGLAAVYARLIDGTIANCEACRQAVIEQEGARPESVFVLPNGDRHVGLRPPRAAPAVRNGRPASSAWWPTCGRSRGPTSSSARRASWPGRIPTSVLKSPARATARRCCSLAAECGIADRLELLGRVDDVPGFPRRARRRRPHLAREGLPTRCWNTWPPAGRSSPRPSAETSS